MTWSGNQRYLGGGMLPLFIVRPEPQAQPRAPRLGNQPLRSSSRGRRAASGTGFSCSGSGLEAATVPRVDTEDSETALSGSSGHTIFCPCGLGEGQGRPSGWCLTSGISCREDV